MLPEKETEQKLEEERGTPPSRLHRTEMGVVGCKVSMERRESSTRLRSRGRERELERGESE